MQAMQTPSFDSGLRLSGPWAIGPRLDQARAGLSATVLEGRIYAAGGAGLANPRDALEVYDPESGAWRVLKPMPVGLERFGMAVLDGKIYVAGGYSSEAGADPIDQVWSYDPETDSWSAETALPGAKASLSLVSVNDRLYALGGEDGAPGLFVYDLETQSWNAAEAPDEINRRGAAAVALEDEIWLIGGARNGQATSRVDVYIHCLKLGAAPRICLNLGPATPPLCWRATFMCLAVAAQTCGEPWPAMSR
jgi:N-acetylneuraminic acid mutarotase